MAEFVGDVNEKERQKDAAERTTKSKISAMVMRRVLLLAVTALPVASSFALLPSESKTYSSFKPFTMDSCLRLSSGSKETKVDTDQAPPAFDEAAYEKDRLEKDQQAMDAMKKVAESEYANLRTPWKWTIRRRIWDYMEENDIANFPRPVHHRIPNFIGADQAALRLAELPEFQAAKCIKVNPDTPQRPVRHQVLEKGKILLTPQPRLRTGFFSTVEMTKLPRLVKVEECTTSKGVVKYGTPLTLYDDYHIDLVVVGSTGVCPETGARVD